MRILSVLTLIVLLAAFCGCHSRHHTEQRNNIPHQSDEVLRSYLNPDRDRWQKPAEVIAAMGLRDGQSIADIGAGSGYFTYRFSQAVGPSGRVWAVDIDDDALAFLQRRMQATPPPYQNVTTVQSHFDDCMLAHGSIDWAFFCDVHFFLEKRLDRASALCLRSIFEALKAGGKLAVIETQYDPIRGAVSINQLCAPFEAAGFHKLAQHDFLIGHGPTPSHRAHERSDQYFVVFGR